MSHHDKATSSALSSSANAVQGAVHQVSTSSQTLLSEAAQLVLETERSPVAQDETDTSVLPFTMDDVMENKLLDINKLNQWDYPIFDLSLEVSDCILSSVSLFAIQLDMELLFIFFLTDDDVQFPINVVVDCLYCARSN